MNSIILLNLAVAMTFLSYLPTSQSFSYLMTCSKFPSMGLNTNLGNMGTVDSAYSTNQIMINGAGVAGSIGTYTPGSTITVSLSPYSGQLVFQATSGAVFQGAAGGNNVNGLLTSGCTAVSRYQMYTETAASLKMPASGTVKIECNFASSSGSGATKVTRPIVLTPVATIVSTVKPSLKPVVASTIQPSFKPIVPSARPSIKPSSKPSTSSQWPSKYIMPITFRPSILINSATSKPSLSLNIQPSQLKSIEPTRHNSSYRPSSKPSRRPRQNRDHEHREKKSSRKPTSMKDDDKNYKNAETARKNTNLDVASIKYIGIAIGILLGLIFLLHICSNYLKQENKVTPVSNPLQYENQ